MDSSRIRPLPSEFCALRDDLRCVGYELLHYTAEHVASVANPIRHPVADYLFGFHKIFGIYPPRVIIETSNRRYCSYQSVRALSAALLESEKPARVAETVGWFKDPASLLLSVLVPPYGLTLFGLGVVGDRQKATEQSRRRALLPTLSEMPEFQQP